MTARAEQETTVCAGRDETHVLIWTNNPTHARRLEKDARVTKVSGNSGDVGGQYRIASEDFDALKGFRRHSRKMTATEREAAAARLSVIRARRAG